AIAEHGIAIRPASRQEGEEVICNVVYLWVDIEKSNMPMRRRPPRHASRTQSNDSDPLVGPLTEHRHHISYGSGRVIVRQGMANTPRIQTLTSVQRIAVK